MFVPQCLTRLKETCLPFWSIFLKKNITAVQFLSQMIEKHVSNASAPVHQKEAASSLLLSEAERPWKKAKLNMLSKHITTVDSKIEREIQQFRRLPITTDDKLA